MELSIYNSKGEVTDKKVNLVDSIFGIEPNEHVIWLDVRQYLEIVVRVPTRRKEEVRLPKYP